MDFSAGTIALTPADRAALLAFWRFYEPHVGELVREVHEAARQHPEWGRVFEARTPAQLAEDIACRCALQRAAILENRWEPYLAALREQGARHAREGVSYPAWFTLLGWFRSLCRKKLIDTARSGPEGLATAIAASEGLHRLADIVLETIGTAYLDASAASATAAEARHRAMFEASPAPMWMFDRDTLRFIEVNEAAIRRYGYSRDELLRMTIADIRPTEDVAELAQDVQQARNYEQRTWRHRKKDGTEILVEISASDFMLDGRQVRLVISHDVTERVHTQQKLRRTEDQLRHAQKLDAIGRLAGGVAHDFNNLLTVIQSYACMLEEQLPPGETSHDDAVEIRRASERAHEITRQLLTLSRHRIITPRSLDLSELATGFVPMLRRLVGEQIKIVTQCTKVPAVLADRGQLEQVLMNLAVNARDAMPAGGRLTIETQHVELDHEAAALRGLAPGSYVAVVVTDTGTGMDAETRARIFEPFFTTKEAGKGTGLGLAIVHGIVTQAGGGIAVYSEPGHGTAFWVYLPVNTSAVEVREPEHVAPPRTLPPMTVLLVDDHADVRAVAARILRDAGCLVVEAATAEEARQACVRHEGTLDVALVDVVLADGRGEALVKELRALRPGLETVLMSGYPAGALTESGGAPRDLLVKPFTPAELRAAVARAKGMAGAGATRAATSPRTRTRVLVADDDDVLRRTLARALTMAGCEVVEVETGRQAIAELERRAVDVILSDVHMPDGSGLELLRAVRRVDLDVPVILISGMPDLQTAASAVEYGVFRYLAKPLDIGALPKLVEHAARVHALARLRRDALSVTGAHLGAAAVDRAGIEVRFDQALDRLWMAFQPIVDARTGVLFGVEALVRSDEPSMAAPPALLDAATQLGRLPHLGRRVRALSAAALAARADAAQLFVNLHPQDLLDIELVDDAAPLSQIASRVVLEVTERAGLQDLRGVAERVARLRALGFRLAVDDIGAGYSGLTTFTELTPEIVKLDMSLVRDIHLSALKQRTVSALCRLCHDVGCLVVAEGIETLDERDCLVDLGSDLLQGYLIGRPQRATAATSRLPQ